jgi:hypothetical protein
MNHPWETIPLIDYERHMSLDSVLQLQTLDEMMRSAMALYPAKTLMILGIAGGNGLEHVDVSVFERVYGVDVNAEYLEACGRRYPELTGTLETIRADLSKDECRLPRADLLLANLLIEYIGCDRFRKAVRETSPHFVSCVIQADSDKSFVSDSPYEHVFDGLEAIHRAVDEKELDDMMADIGYCTELREEKSLPNGKRLVRLDYKCADEP